MTRPRGERKASRLVTARLAVTSALLVLPPLLGNERERRPGGGLLSLYPQRLCPFTSTWHSERMLSCCIGWLNSWASLRFSKCAASAYGSKVVAQGMEEYIIVGPRWELISLAVGFRDETISW